MVRQSVVCHYSVCIEVIVSDFEQLLWINWNHTIKNSTHNVQRINIYDSEARNFK
jgi:hypothetical protein